MNKARYAAAVIAAVGVSITAGGAAAAIWQYRHAPVHKRSAPAVAAAAAPVLPLASSAPYPHAAIHHPGAFHYLGTMHRPDGSYRYSAQYVTTPVWVTSQVLAALARKTFPLAG